MKFIGSANAEKIQTVSTCIATEYSFGNIALDIALIQISGRYPEKGRVYNERSIEAAFIVEGGGA